MMMACRDDGKWACRQYAEWVPRQNGKGALLEARALAGFLLLGEELIMFSAHEFKTSIRAWRRMRKLIKRLGTQVGRDENLFSIRAGDKPILVKIVNSHGEEGFERLDTLAELKFLARSKGSGRGFSGDLSIIDEAFAYTPEQQEAMAPTLRARPNPQTVYTSTPPLDGDSGEVMYGLRKRAMAGDFAGLGYRDWGLATPLEDRHTIDLDDRALWAATNPAYGDPDEGARIGEEDVIADRETLVSNDARGFARECLGMWPTQSALAGGTIRPEQWEKLQDPKSKRDKGSGVALGLSIAPNREYAAIALYGIRKKDGLGHAQLVDRRAGTAWLVPRLVELRKALDPITVAMSRSAFESLEDELREEGLEEPEDPNDPWHGELLVMSAIGQAASCGQILDGVRDGDFRVRPHKVYPKVLDEAALGAKTRRVGDTVAWSRKDDDVEISPWDAVSAARHGFVTRAKATEVENLEGSLMV